MTATDNQPRLRRKQKEITTMNSAIIVCREDEGWLGDLNEAPNEDWEDAGALSQSEYIAKRMEQERWR